MHSRQLLTAAQAVERGQPVHFATWTSAGRFCAEGCPFKLLLDVWYFLSSVSSVGKVGGHVADGLLRALRVTAGTPEPDCSMPGYGKRTWESHPAQA